MKQRIRLDNFRTWHIILFFLFFTVGTDDLTCVLSVSSAHGYPWRGVSVFF